MATTTRPEQTLTPRELDVMRLIAQGKGQVVIAMTLDVAVQTVRNMLRTIYDKTGMGGRVELLQWWEGKGRALYEQPAPKQLGHANNRSY